MDLNLIHSFFSPFDVVTRHKLQPLKLDYTHSNFVFGIKIPNWNVIRLILIEIERPTIYNYEKLQL